MEFLETTGTSGRRGAPTLPRRDEVAMSQNQNRFKRRERFWSKSGFASFLAVYVWYTNDELDVIYRQSA